jgi:hypothetical protein
MQILISHAYFVFQNFENIESLFHFERIFKFFFYQINFE